MNLKQRWTMALAGTALAVTLALGATATFAQEPETTPPTPPAQETPGERGFGFHGPRGDRGARDEALAEALGITVEELQAAREQAHEQMLTEAVAEGRLTQEQADLIRAGQALRQYIDKEAIMAEVLGMSVEALEAAKAEGQRLPEIIEAQGMDQASFHEAMQAAHEAAIQEAIADGVITQEQADQLQSMQGFRGRGGRHGFGGHGPRGPRFETPTTPSSDS